MKKKKIVFVGILYVGFLVLTVGCCTTWTKVSQLPPTPSTQQITHSNVVIDSAVLPNSNPSDISVNDRCPSNGDGNNDIWIGWSESNVGAAKYATINFPSTTFGDGPTRVCVKCCHYNDLELKAYDKNGNLIDTAVHPGPQGTNKQLTLKGGHIFKIDIIGAEIGIVDIGYNQ